MEDRIKQLEEEVKIWRDRYEALKRWIGNDLEEEWTYELPDDEWTWYYDENTGEMYAKDHKDQIKHRLDTQQKEKDYYNSESEGKETRN